MPSTKHEGRSTLQHFRCIKEGLDYFPSMELEIGRALVRLIVLSLLATVDMALAQLSDVGLRRLIGENGDKPESRSRLFLRQALENRPRFGFALSATIQILLVVVAV